MIIIHYHYVDFFNEKDEKGGYVNVCVKLPAGESFDAASFAKNHVLDKWTGGREYNTSMRYDGKIYPTK